MERGQLGLLPMQSFSPSNFEGVLFGIRIDERLKIWYILNMSDRKISKIALLFEGQKIRRHWDGDKELWHFAIMDVIEVLVKTDRPRKWNDLKTRLKQEGSEVSEKIGQLKMRAADGKYYMTDSADTETMLRLIQSIPSPNAEPFKLWLAKVGYERLEETADPELAINRALKTYLQKGYSKDWINQRLKSIEIRKTLTDEWENRGVKEGFEFAILTNEITEAWTGLTTKEYKNLKGLRKENLRDNMTNLELVLNMLAETATTEISQKREPKDFEQNKKVAREGGSIAGNARKQIEAKTGKKIINKFNFKATQEKKKLK
ncbi:MAG: DNA-damage-inducible protein d [Candidatus Nomurabacteria bacterium GW2011_GWB1_37_5]|uniref:DNA-damage-inducible protein d n=1 Tax=Candidatus Nomurabacteria bacterium GW2011_GWB1_37_5 TaxID=1618742 RepID=A0A0G0JG62_9BACT|nr:MAG: DNA-damage-inducible protein d [Candidatus Nomurabacteria bacterium GW2011_GWB1_37_5]